MSVDTNLTNDYGQYDDLEAALVIAAADADARNHVRVEEERENDGENSKLEYEESLGYYQNEDRRVEENEEEKRSRKRRSDVKADNEAERSTKYLKTNEKTAIGASKDGYATVVAEHYNTLQEKGLDERSKSRIVHMRNFHNWIKSMLINEYLTKIKDNKKHHEHVRVMDMCCGKGGDLLKWKKGGITHLICTDIAAVSLDQCKSRYEEMKLRSYRERHPSNIYSIEYIAGDSSRVSIRQKYKDVTMKLDLVSCQFAFHYSFESLQQAECMIRNAAECIQPGGYFIGTIPDANELLARVQKSNTNSFGNDVYRVTFECDTNRPPFFGAKYNFHLDGVVDCPEFLVYFPVFEKLAKKYGLKLVRKEKFSEFYERMKMEGRTLMGNMRALETYPSPPGMSPAGNAPDDYAHADEFLKKEGLDGTRIGTLSKSEWEASSLYMTFAFQKVKNTWNADGTPCYEI